jgi:4-hydroxy-tetrahydrodipicolinate synthase
MSSRRELAQPIRGIIPPMVTPLADQNTLDHAAAERLVEHLISGGVHGLFILGTCGEGMSLGHSARRELVDAVCRQVDSRVPVLVSISDTAFAESIDLAKFSAEAGADALVLAPPCYYAIGQDELARYVRGIVRQVPLPVVLYNIPEFTKVALEPETVRELMDEEGIIGLKDSSGDLDYFETIRQISRARKDWALLTGMEHYLSRSLELGGDGGVCAGANVWPELFVRIYEAATVLSNSTIDDHQDVLNDLVDKADRLGQIYRFGARSASDMVKGLKAALSVLELCDDRLAAPLERYSARERQQVEKVLQAIGMEAARAASISRL